MQVTQDLNDKRHHRAMGGPQQMSISVIRWKKRASS
jgi:hypothetical protein